MARCQANHGWIARGDAANLKHALHGFFARHSMTVVRDDGMETEVTQGSQLRTRLLGGWFVNGKHFPKRAMVRFTPAPESGGTRVDVHIEETLGFGVLDPIFEDRYQAYFRTWIEELVRTLG
jgi:hypothetical protein